MGGQGATLACDLADEREAWLFRSQSLQSNKFMTKWWLNYILGIVFQVRVTFYFQVRTLQMQAYQMTVSVIRNLHK